MNEKPYRNQLDATGTCSEVGAKAEEVFAEILRKEGYEVRMANFSEQMRHLDIIATKNKKEFTFDVKSRKKVSRSDDSAQDSLVWIEVLSVSGRMGWAFSNVDNIAFEREKDFVVVSQKKLADFVTKNCNLKKIAYTAKDAVYCKYERSGRKDCLTLIKNEDIVKLAKKIFPK